MAWQRQLLSGPLGLHPSKFWFSFSLLLLYSYIIVLQLSHSTQLARPPSALLQRTLSLPRALVRFSPSQPAENNKCCSGAAGEQRARVLWASM